MLPFSPTPSLIVHFPFPPSCTYIGTPSQDGNLQRLKECLQEKVWTRFRGHRNHFPLIETVYILPQRNFELEEFSAFTSSRPFIMPVRVLESPGHAGKGTSMAHAWFFSQLCPSQGLMLDPRQQGTPAAATLILDTGWSILFLTIPFLFPHEAVEKTTREKAAGPANSPKWLLIADPCLALTSFGPSERELEISLRIRPHYLKK